MFGPNERTLKYSLFLFLWNKSLNKLEIIDFRHDLFPFLSLNHLIPLINVFSKMMWKNCAIELWKRVWRDLGVIEDRALYFLHPISLHLTHFKCIFSQAYSINISSSSSIIINLCGVFKKRIFLFLKSPVSIHKLNTVEDIRFLFCCATSMCQFVNSMYHTALNLSLYGGGREIILFSLVFFQGIVLFFML